MNRRSLFAASAIGFALSLSAHAQEADGTRSAKSLVDGCAVANAILDGTADQRFGERNFGENMYAVGVCYGYIEGFLQGFSAGRGAPQSADRCIPEGVSTPQIARVLEDRMKKMPEVEHLDRMPFVMAVLKTTWPCSE